MSLTKVINTGIKNAEITGSKINTSSNFSFDVLQANTLTVTNEFQSNSVNSAFNTANAASSYANSAFIHANSAYTEANLKFNSSGGLISGDVTISGNIVPTTDVTYNIGNSSNRIHTIFVGPGSVNIDGIILSNNNGLLTVSGASDFSVQGLPTASDTSDKINLVFDSANSASSYANGSFAVANVADQRAVTSGVYANAAYLQANTPSQVANATSSYANGSFAAANVANQRAVTSGDYANSAYAEANVRATTTYVDNAVANLVNSAPSTLDTLNELAAALNNDPDFATTIATNIGIIGNYSNAAYLQANTPSRVANSAGVYANAAYGQANTANILAQFSFDSSNLNSSDIIIVGDYANSAFSEANAALQKAFEVEDYAINVNAHAVSSFNQANTADQKAVTSGVYANSAFLVANTPSQVANSASSYANSGYSQANSNFTSAVTQLVVTTPVFNYNIDQYSGDNPTIYVTAGETIAFDLNQSASHPFAIRVSNGGSNYNTGLTHVDDNGTISTGSSAQNKVSGKLYWKIPFELVGLTYVYQCTNHSSMVGNIVIQPPASFVASNTQLAFGAANSAGVYANSSYTQANTATNNAATADQKAVSSGVYANNAFGQANTATTNATTADSKAVNAGNYANSAYSAANTADSKAVTSGNYANSAFDSANIADAKAVTSGLYANAAFSFANTISGGSAIDNVARTSANSANSTAQSAIILAQAAFDQANIGGSSVDTFARTQANSAYLQANTPSHVANSASSYANSGFGVANTANTLAQSAYDAANNAIDNVARTSANSASSYANSGFGVANTANTLAQAAYDQANTGGGGGGSGLFNPLINVATGYAVTSSLANAVVFSANAIVHSIYLTNISNVSTSNIQVTGDFTPSGTSNVSIFHKIPLPYRSSVEMLKKPQIVKTNDILKLQSFNNDVGVSANAYAIIVYETTTETNYERVGKLVTDAYSNMYTSTSNPSVVESIKLVNRDSAYGNHAVTVVWTNSANTLQGYLTKELILPANSTIELCETPKYMNAGDKFDAWATTTDVISIFVSAKKII